MMKKFSRFLLFLTLVAICGCGKEEPKSDPKNELSALVEKRKNELVASVADGKTEKVLAECVASSHDVVRRTLADIGVDEGCDAEHGRIVAVATRSFSLKGDEKDDEFELKESYDFADDDSDDFETKRFKTMWKAYADGLAEIAKMIATQIKDETVKVKTDSGNVTKNIEAVAELRLDGVVTVTSAEALNNENGEYEFTVAVCQSRKRQKLYKDGLLGDGPSHPGQFSLKEWIDENSSMGMICPQSFVDNAGVWWRVAGVPVDLSSGRYSKKVALLTEKAKRYAYEAAIRTIWVDVSTYMSMGSLSYDGDEYDGDEIETKEKISRKVSIKPLCNILPNDPFRVKWVELDRDSSITGKPIRLIVCAIRDDIGARNAERKFFEERLIKERQEAYERGRRDAEMLTSKKADD